MREATRQHHEHGGKRKNTKRVRSQDLAVDPPYGGRCLCGERTFKREQDIRGGCLNQGENFRHGPSPIAPSFGTLRP